MNLVVAVSETQGISRDEGFLTHLSGDMRYFRETTRGKIVVMGRKTLGNFPDVKPLKSRINIVLTQNRDYCPEGMIICHSVNETLETLKQYPEEDISIVGGEVIHGESLPYCKKAYVTCIRGIFQADTKFVDPDREKDQEWECAGEIWEYNDLAYEFRVYIRRQQE